MAKAKGKTSARKPTPSKARKSIAKKQVAKPARLITPAIAAANLKAAKAKAKPSADRRIARAHRANTNTPTARAIGQPTLAVDKILIGKRHRTEFGDISGLTDSINARGGLLQPIVVTPGHTLIAGERRIRAWSLSKFRDQPIPVTVVDVDSIVAGEWDENAQRKDFTPSEAVAIKRALEPLEKAAAALRLAHGKTAPGKKGGEVKGHGRARDKIAAVVGMDPKTIAKAEAIVDAADSDPEKFGKLKEQMDRTGNVSGPHKRLTNMRQSEAIKAEPPPLPGKGPYRAGVIDWPWASEPDGQSPAETGRGYFNYPTMTTAEMIAAGPAIRAILNPDAWIWNWVTNFHLVKGHAFAVLDGVFGELPGYERVHIRTGVKDKIGRGQVLRGDTEHAILIKVGNPPAVNLTNQTTSFPFKVRKDSQKPDNFYADVEALTPAPRYFELFSRRVMPDNWDGHGDQVGMFELPRIVAPDEPGHAGAPAKARKPRAKKTATSDTPPPAPAAEPTLPGIPPAAVVENAELVDGADRDLDQATAMPRASDVRRAVDAKATAGAYVEVRVNTHPVVWEAFDKISHDSGAGSGYAAYPVPQAWADDLAAIDGALATLSPAELTEFAIGDQDIADTIAARSEHLGRAHGLLGAFFRGWYKDDEAADQQPPDDDPDGIPAFLRRKAAAA